MKKKKLWSLIFPSTKINFFSITLLMIGILSGSIFLMVSSEADKNVVITHIQNFFSNIASNNIEYGLALKNSLIINYLFVIGIWILGFSVIGIIFNIFLTYIKGFLVGFSISSIFLTYGYKGAIAVILYTFPSQILNLLVVIILTIYSIMFTLNLIKVILSKSNNQRLVLKRYLIIFIFCIIISFISSLLEVYVFPNLLKIIISIYLK